MFDKIQCLNFSFNGYLLSSALTIIFLMEMFTTPRNVSRNCKWTLSTSVLSQVEKYYPHMDSRLHCHTKGLVRLKPCSHGYDIVPFRSGPKSDTEGVAFTWVRKKSSGLFQNRSRNWAIQKSEPEVGTIRYRTVPFSCEQKNRSSLGPLSGPVWFPRVTRSWFLWPRLIFRLRVDLIAPH